MADYTTANLRLPSRIYEELRHHSRRRGVSLASLVRAAVSQYLGHEVSGTAVPMGADPVDGLVGSVRGGARDESVDHDHYLYDWPRETADETAGRHGRTAGQPSL